MSSSIPEKFCIYLKDQSYALHNRISNLVPGSNLVFDKIFGILEVVACSNPRPDKNEAVADVLDSIKCRNVERLKFY
jgi:hypothetical protein